MSEFRKRVETRMTFCGIGRTALAGRIGVTSACLGNWLTHNEPTALKLAHLDAMAAALGVSREYLTDADDTLWAEVNNPIPEWIASKEPVE